MTTSVLLPVDVVRVRATVAPERTISRLEELVLRAVHAEEISSLPRLATLFSLQDRVMLDLIWGLWTDGRVLVDLHSGEIRVTSAVAAAIDDNALRDLSRARAREIIVELMVDPVSGQVGTVADTLGPITGAVIAPSPSAPVAIEDVPVADLLAAVLRAFDQRRRDAVGERFRVLSVDLSQPFGSGATSRRRFRSIDVHVTADAGIIQPVVSDPSSGLTSIQRDRVNGFLAQCLEADPLGRLATALVQSVSTIPARPHGIEQRLDAMRSLVAKVSPSGVAAQDYQSAHDRLAHLSSSVDGELQLRQRTAQPARLLASASSINAAARELIAQARRQVVMTSPWVRGAALNTFVESLEEAMQRGVHIVLLWGIGLSDQLEPDALNLLISLRDRHPERLHFSVRSSRTHAKMVIGDNRQLIVSSHNLLSSGGGLAELGLLIEARDAGDCPPIEAALEWARQNYPDWRVAAGFLTNHGQFVPSWKQSAVAQPPYPPTEPTASETDRAAWRHAWTVRIDEFDVQERASQTRVEGIVFDQAHRFLLNTALSEARRRLMVASPTLADQALTPAVLTKLTSALSSNPELIVTIVSAAESEGTSEASKDSVSLSARLEALSAQFDGRIRVAFVDRWHAKTLIYDEHVVISSFNFLSFEGHYVESIRRSRSEIGIHVVDPALSDSVAVAVERLASLPSDGHATLSHVASPERQGTNGTRARRADAAREILAVEAAQAIERFAAAPLDQRYQLLDELVHLDVSPELCDRLAARALLDEPNSRWEERVGMAAWNRQEFLLAHAILPSTTSPSAALRLVGLSLDTQLLSRAVASAVAEGCPPGEAEAVCLCGVYALLRGQDEAERALESLTVLPTLRAATLRYWGREYQPLPWGLLSSRRDSAAHAGACEAARTGIFEVVGEVRTWGGFNFAAGSQLRRHLAQGDSSLGVLVALAAQDTPPAPDALDVWLQRWGASGADFIDAHRDIAYDEPIIGSRRQGLIKKADRVLAAVREWRNRLADCGDAVVLSRSVQELNAAFVGARMELDAGRASSTPAARVVVDAVVERMGAIGDDAV